MMIICGSGKLLKAAIKKYGIENFLKEILFECKDESEMNQKEAEIVNNEFISRLDTYNLQLGGGGGWNYFNKNNFNKGYKLLENHEYAKKFSDLGRTKIKEIKEKNPAYYAKIKLIWTNALFKGLGDRLGHTFDGRHHTEEAKKKIGQINSIKQKGKLNSQFGKCWIYNPKEKISKSIKKTELNEWLNKGWIKGRKMIF